MIPDLICNKLRRGIKKDEVISMLGKPDQANWSNDHPNLRWESGQYPGSSVATEIIIKFDNNNKLQDLYSHYWWGSMSYYSAPLGFLKCIKI
jgi:hypothetical protein